MKNIIEKDKKHKSGIYQIRNLSNNKIYIGSAFNLLDRFHCHKSLLKNNKHGNQHLQRSYNRNPDDFIFEIVEFVDDISKIYEIEQIYIDITYGKNCYNISKKTNEYNSLLKNNKLRREKFQLIDKENKLYDFSGLADTSRILNLNFRLLRNLVIGKSLSYKGWRLPKNIDYNPKNYRKSKGRGAEIHNVRLISPDGEIHGPIFNIEEFCRNNKLVASNLRHVISKKNKSHRGWCLYDESYTKFIGKNAKEYSLSLISPKGEIFTQISNLNKFCRDRNLSPSGIRRLIKGQIKKLNYKGWKLIN
jgi:group I intron endonuclease